MDPNANISSRAWCQQCRRYIADPAEVGAEFDGICHQCGWALLKLEGRDAENEAGVSQGGGSPYGAEDIFPSKKEKPLLREGRGIAVQSAVQFSHVSKEVQKNDTNLRRRKDDGIMATLAGVLLGICAVVAFFTFSLQGETETSREDSPTVADSQRMTNLVTGSKEEVMKFVDEVSRIDDVDGLLKVIRFPELLESMVRARHESVGTNFSFLSQMAVLNYSYTEIYGSRFAALSMGGTDGVIVGVVLVEITDEGKMLLDWEILVGAAQRYWLDFEKKKPTEPVPLWVSIHRTSIVDLPLPEGEDSAQWMAVKVMSPTLGINGSAYLTLVKKGNAFGDYVEQHIPWNSDAPSGRTMAVKARFSEGTSPKLMIDEFRAPGGFRSSVDDALYPLKDW